MRSMRPAIERVVPPLQRVIALLAIAREQGAMRRGMDLRRQSRPAGDGACQALGVPEEVLVQKMGDFGMLVAPR